MNSNIIAYFPSWTGSVNDIPFEKITHVNYSFVFPTPWGSLTEVDDGRMKDMVARAHAHGVKACLAIGGWNDGDCSAFEAMASGTASRQAFIRNVLELRDRYRLDGIDIDWEYPKAFSSGDYLRLMRELREALGPKALLTTAVVAEDDIFKWGSFIPSEVFAVIDFLNIMAYDWHYQARGTHHSPLSLAESTLDYWLGRGCPRHKAILGVPFYGRSETVFLNYRELVAKDPMVPYKDISGDIQYNGLETMRRKTRLALRKGGGIMFWEITQDTRDQTSLLNAILETAKSL